MGDRVQHIDLKQIRAAVGLLAAIVEGSDDPIIAKDLDGRIISWNPAAVRMFGYTEDEALGERIQMLIPDEHRGEDQAVMDRILNGASVEHYETQRVSKDGRVIDVSLTVSPLRDEHGEVIGASKIMRDITSSRAARRMQEHFAAIVESTDDAMITKDPTGHVTSWNAAAQRIFGYSAEEMIGQPITKLFPPELIGSERDILSEVLSGRKVDHYETVRLASDGRRVDVSLTVSPLRDEQGEIVGASKVARDISERKRIEANERRAAELARMNEELEAADRMKDQFLAMANHELRTPLTSISGFTRTLIDLDEQLSRSQQREFLDIIAQQSDRLTRLVDDMLTLSRIELGRAEVRSEEFDAVESVRAALRAADRANVAVKVTEAEPIVACADAHQFEQMLLNYVDNALKYGAGSPDCVEVQGDSTSVLVSVADEGPGVPAEFRPALFQRFSRNPEHELSRVPGVGLGLSIVRGLARAQGGDAWYEDNEPRGSRFMLRVPRAGTATT
jgi:PAS domain S-box-containing protein